MRISDWSSDVCSSDLLIARDGTVTFPSSGCSAGRCAKVSGWETDGDFWDDGEAGYQTGTGVAIGDASLSPRFIIEAYGTSSVLGDTSSCIDLSKPCISGTSQNVNRITSYARTANGAEVILDRKSTRLNSRNSS